jgi:hypothetical protein
MGNAFKLANGEKVKINLKEDDGFISEISFDNGNFLEPNNYKEQLEEHLKWVQINQVALFTRLRFFQLKNKVEFNGIDINKLAAEISKAR